MMAVIDHSGPMTTTMMMMMMTTKKKKKKKKYQVLISISHDDIQYPLWLSNEALSILQGFLNKNPAQRLVAPEAIRSHPFFTGMVSEELQKKHVDPPIQPKIVKTNKHQVDLDTLITPVLPVCGDD